MSCLLAASLPLAARAASPPPPIYVSITGSDATGTGSIGNPFATISHGVSTAVSGQTVIVGPGTYKEMVLVTKQLTLTSETMQPSSTTIDATGQPVGIAVVGSSSSGTVVEGFTVTHANNEGIFVQDSSKVVVDNNVVSNNAFNVVPGLGEVKGIQLAGASDSTVAGNTVVGNGYGGIGVTDDGPVDASWNATAAPTSGIPAGTPNPGNSNLISGNMVENNHPNHCAIVLSAYDPNEGVSNNIVSGNTVVDNQNGVIVAADTPNTIAINNTVIYNTILNNGEGGVIVHSNAPGDVVKGNSIMYNVFSANGYLPTLEGVIIGGEGTVPVTDTTIVGNVFQNEAIAVQIVLGTNTMVDGNIIGSTVRVAYNGTVIQIGTSSTGPTSTVTETVSATVTQTVVSTQTSVVASNETATSTSSGGLTFSLALITAVGTLIVGLIVGMIVRPIREASAK
jgi:parallel beta-helix repeat protein